MTERIRRQAKKKTEPCLCLWLSIYGCLWLCLWPNELQISSEQDKISLHDRLSRRDESVAS